MNPVCQLEWCDGTLRTTDPSGGVCLWEGPAELAAARLACCPPAGTLDVPDGAALLTAAFRTLPFVAPPFPEPTFGGRVTAAARRAFRLLWEGATGRDDFRVLRGEPDDFLVCAGRRGAEWEVGAFTVRPTTLTVRVEDIWRRTPRELRRTRYTVEVLRDPHAKDTAAAQTAGLVRETLTDVAPDARICLDLLGGGGFVLFMV